MNRVVREHYPAAKLPEDLREGFPADASVTVVVKLDAVPDAEKTKLISLEELFARARPSFNSMEEVADHIRSIREEWD